MNSKSKRCSRSCQEMLLTYSVGKESSASRQAVTAEQKESVWFPIQEDSLRLFTEFSKRQAWFTFARSSFRWPFLQHNQVGKSNCRTRPYNHTFVADSALKNHEDFCIAMKRTTLQARIKNWASLVRGKVDIATRAGNLSRDRRHNHSS